MTPKAIAEFPRDKTKRDGLATRCKACKYAAVRRWKENNPDRAKESVRRSYEKHSDKYRAKSRERYAVDGAERRREHRRANPERSRQVLSEWAAKNPEKIKEYAQRNYRKRADQVKQDAKKWAQANPKKRSAIMAFQNAKRRSRKKANGGRGFSRDHWTELVRRVDGLCAYCRTEPVSSIDHFEPLTRSGMDDFANIVPACRLCNSSKNNNEPNAWVAETFGTERLAYVRSIMFQ